MKRVKHSDKLPEVEIDRRLKAYFVDHQIIQRMDFQTIRGMVRSTAMIHIRRLRKERKLLNIGLPNQPIYMSASGFYGKSNDYQPVKQQRNGWKQATLYEWHCFQPLSFSLSGKRLQRTAECRNHFITLLFLPIPHG